MFGSNRSANGSSHSRRTKKYTEKKFELDSNKRLRAYDENKKSNEASKVEFRKVLKPRNKHSRVGQLDDSQQKSVVSNRSSRLFSQTLNDLEKQNKEKLEKQTLQDKKFNFKNSPLNRVKNEENDIAIYQSKQVEQSRPQSSLSKRQQFYSSRSNIRPDKENQQQHQKSQDNEQFNKKSLLRPKSSIYNFSPFENVKTKQRNTSQLSQPKNDLQKMQKIKRQSMHTQNQHNAINQFFILEQKIMNLLAVKWDIIEQKLMKQKEQSRISKPNQRLKTKHNKPTFFQNSLQKNQVSLKQNQKFSFSKALAQKNIDLQIMDLIKSLRKLNLSSLKSNKSIENQKIWSDIQQRRSQIIQKVLAQSMVESQLLKKYYSGQNAKCLSTSNHKVGQNNMKNKLMLQNIKKIQTSERTQVQNSQRKISQQRQSFQKQSESKSHFIAPNSQDYEKYRYKHPEFKPNLQPLPRSSYKSQFFNYSNVQIYNSKYKQQGNMVFPATSALKSSSYRKQYRQFSPERINYKQLDAYKDKFKNIDIVYMPKKRSQSEAYTTRKCSKVNKYVNKLDYVKRLKTESMIGNPLDKEVTQRINCKLFTTESKNQYQNPQKLTQHFEKSEIKHKKLHMLKYDMKKKFRV